MDKLIQKLGGYCSAKHREFMDALKDVGANLTTWYEAVQYKGEPKELIFELCVKRGLFSKDRVAAGDDARSLYSMASYINNHPSHKNWKFIVKRCRQVLKNGDFAIVERRGFKGGERQAVRDVIIHFGGDQECIEYILDKVEEDTLGYLLSVASQEAKALAEIVHVGATAPVSREEMVKLAELARRGAKSRVATGDKSFEVLVGFWDKLANYWRSVPVDQLYVKLATQYYDEGLIEKAIGEYQKAIQMYPNNADYHYDLGILLEESSKLDSAIVEYVEAIRINPTHYFAHNNLGQVYESQGKLDEAKEQFRDAIKIDPRKPHAHGNLGRVYYHQGFLDDAIAEYEECLRLNPKHTSADSVRDLTKVTRDEKNRINELEKAKVEAWHAVSGSNVVRFWGISIYRFEQLMKEWENLEMVYESLRKNMSQEEIDPFFTFIAKSQDLTLDQKAIADFALLEIVEGLIPTSRGTECLKIAFRSQPELLEALLKRCINTSD